MHTTYSIKVGSIFAHGLRVSPRTVRGTAFTRKGEISEARLAAYMRSEAKLEEVRRRLRPELPTRAMAVFFYPDGYAPVTEEPAAFTSGEDAYGRPLYDFGFGKDVAIVVDFDRVPGRCGVGDTSKSDNVFAYYLDLEREGGSEQISTREGSDALAEVFWKGARLYDPRTYESLPEGYRNSCTDCSIQEHEMPEVWCPSPIPRGAIVGHYDGRNPIPVL